MDITGIAKSHQAGIQKTGKKSSKKDWKLSDSLRENITKYAKECCYPFFLTHNYHGCLSQN